MDKIIVEPKWEETTPKRNFIQKLFFEKPFPEHIDLDIFAVMLTKTGKVYDITYYGDRLSHDTAVHHFDNSISINFLQVSKEVKYIFIVLNNYYHYKLDNVSHIDLNIYSNDEMICSFGTDNSETNKESIVLGYFNRENKWEFMPTWLFTTEPTIRDIISGSIKDIIK